VQPQAGLSAAGTITLDSVVNQKDARLQRPPAFLWFALKTGLPIAWWFIKSADNRDRVAGRNPSGTPSRMRTGAPD
jgi:hypothetical protein